jgi:Holliday junction resolvasome RuvABC endonuclease subunit
VLGIDPSLTSTGYAYWKDGVLVSGCIDPGDLKGEYRLFYVKNMLAVILEEVNPTLVSYEDYAMGFGGGKKGGSFGRVFHIGELGGVLKTLIWERGFNLMLVSPSVVKSAISSHGQADKAAIMASLKSRYGLTVTQHDEADAVALMLLGEMRCGLRPYPKTDAKSKLKGVQGCEIRRGKLQKVTPKT